MKETGKTLLKAGKMLVIFAVICGFLYTGAITGLAQVFFPHQAQGSQLVVDGKTYGSELLGQYYRDNGHLWGREMELDFSHTDKDGNPLLYGRPSNLSVTSDDCQNLIKERVKKMQAANPEMGDTPVPVDLITGSGSGLDPQISPAAAKYQVARIAKARGMSREEVEAIIGKCTQGRLLGVFGEETVNVLKVNLMLDGILKA